MSKDKPESFDDFKEGLPQLLDEMADDTAEHLLEVVGEWCSELEGNVTQYYKGDAKTANELLKYLREYVGNK